MKNIKKEEALPKIRREILLLKVNQKKANYLNSLVEKYELNKKLDKYYPNEQINK